MGETEIMRDIVFESDYMSKHTLNHIIVLAIEVRCFLGLLIICCLILIREKFEKKFEDVAPRIAASG